MPTTVLALRRIAIIATLVAVAFLLMGQFVPPAIDRALHQGILDQIVWRPDSPPEVDARFRGLADPEGNPDFFRVWVWNLTNLEEVRQGAKPRMAEVGPLTYIKHRVKVDVSWDRRGRVAVKEWDYHLFQPDLSAASPSDPITTLNLPLVGVLEQLHAASAVAPTVRPLLDVLVGVLSGWRDEHVDGLFVRRTAGELVWGYEDLLLERLQLLLGKTFVRSSTVQLIPNDTSADYVRQTRAPSVIDTGWRPAGSAVGEGEGADDGLGGNTGSSSSSGGGWDALHSGDVDVDGLGGRRSGQRSSRLRSSRPSLLADEDSIWNMEAQNGYSSVTAWGPGCEEVVRGTDAFQFPPGRTRNQTLRVWINELYRSAALIYLDDTELYGIRLLRYIPNPAEAAPDPCHHQIIQGLANVTVPTAVGPTGNGSGPGTHGVPLLLSLPHFCLVDAVVVGGLEGVVCDLTRHGLFLDVEPTTGITMRAAKRLQLSSQLTDAARSTLEPGINTSFILPIFWAEEASELAPKQAATFRGTVYRAQQLAATARMVSYLAAAALAAAGALAATLLAARGRRAQDDGGTDRAEAGRGGGGVAEPRSPPSGNGLTGNGARVVEGAPSVGPGASPSNGRTSHVTVVEDTAALVSAAATAAAAGRPAKKEAQVADAVGSLTWVAAEGGALREPLLGSGDGDGPEDR